MEINGLPLHPLVVHSAVIFGPLAALAALAYLVPRWRDRVRWPMVILAVVGVGAVVAAYFTGGDFLDSKPELRQLPAVRKHEDLGDLALYAALAFGAVALLSGWLHSRTGAIRVVLNVVLAIAAVTMLVAVIRSGDSGAQAVWG
jgi:uncharacterized membrane protein